MKFKIFKILNSIYIADKNVTLIVNLDSESIKINKRLYIKKEDKLIIESVSNEELDTVLYCMEKLIHVLKDRDIVFKNQRSKEFNFYNIYNKSEYNNDDVVCLANNVLFYYHYIHHRKFIELYKMPNVIEQIEKIIYCNDDVNTYSMLPEDLKKEKKIILAHLQKTNFSSYFIKKIEQYLDEELLLDIFNSGKIIDIDIFKNHKELLKYILLNETYSIKGR